MGQALWVFVGGGLGAVLRYAISIWIPFKDKGFPTATFLVNVLGCLLIGVLWYGLAKSEATWLRPFIIVGLLGGFTTFSSFGLETFRLLQEGQWAPGLAYFFLSNIVGLLFVYLGSKIGTI
jgi:CrcB protein